MGDAFWKDEKYVCARCGNVESICDLDMVRNGNPGAYQLVCHKCLGVVRKRRI